MKSDMRQVRPALRQIGFRLWDPLGLVSDWKQGEAMADDYDGYLLRAYSAAVNCRRPEAIYTVLRQAKAVMGIPDAGTTERHMRVAQVILVLSGDGLPE